MTRPAVVALCALLTPVFLQGQARHEFEVASIRPSADLSRSDAAGVGVHISGSQVRITGMSIKDYVMTAYGVRPTQVSGPDWMAQDRFDIAAKLPDGSAAADVPGMLQTLLADRFDLVVHHESRQFPVFALVATKSGFSLKPRAAEAATPAGTTNILAGGSADGVAVDLGDGSFVRLANNQLTATRMTMASLANVMTRFEDRPVLDETGIDGAYDFVLELTPEEYNATLLRSAVNAGVVLPPQALRALDNAAGNPLAAPLAKFGLTLDSRRAPLDVVVVDSVRRAPKDN